MDTSGKQKPSIIGTAIGAGLVGAAAGAGAALLAQKQNRDKLQKAVNSIKKHTQKNMDMAGSKIDEMKEKAEDIKKVVDGKNSSK